MIRLQPSTDPYATDFLFRQGIGAVEGITHSPAGEAGNWVEIDPHPRTTPIRPSLQPLRGATITDFHDLGDNAYSLEDQLQGRKYYVNYRIDGDRYHFEFIDAAGQKRVETDP